MNTILVVNKRVNHIVFVQINCLNLKTSVTELKAKEMKNI